MTGDKETNPYRQDDWIDNLVQKLCNFLDKICGYDNSSNL